MAKQLDSVEEAPGLHLPRQLAAGLDAGDAAWRRTARSRSRSSPSAAPPAGSRPACCATTGASGNADSQYDPGAGGKQTLGLLYSQWLATVLQAMGVPPSEFERWGYKGYGYPFITKETWTPPFAKHYGDTSSRYFQDASNWLPFLKAYRPRGEERSVG